MNEEIQTGLVHVYTGTGKGKTTSAVGLAVRALGRGLDIVYVSFHKRHDLYGYTEVESLKKLGAHVLHFAQGHPGLDGSIDPDFLKKETIRGLDFLTKYLKNHQPHLLILDEILISVRDEYLLEDKLIQFIENKPQQTELVLTGRGATPKVIEHADYVSEIQKVKHPFDQGIRSRAGIEY